MNKKSCKEALEIYKKFLSRMDSVKEFLKVAEVGNEWLLLVLQYPLYSYCSLLTTELQRDHRQALRYLYMNLWLELDNCLPVAQLVRALHRNRRAAGSIPARGLIVAFFATATG